MASREAQVAEVRANYDAFAAALPDLLPQHRGKFAAYRHRSLVGIFESFKEALNYCTSEYGDHLFSIQEITAEPLDLGWLSHASDESSIRSHGRPDH